MRASTLTGFVGVHAALDAPLDGQADNGAEAGLEAEGALDDQHHDFRQLRDVQQDDHHRDQDVAQRHEWHDHLSEVGDALDTTEDDQTDQHGQYGGGDVRVDTEGGVHAGGDGVGLYARQQQAAGEHGNDGEQPGVPLQAQATLDVEGRATTVFTVELFLVHLAEGGLDERRAGAEEGHHPHPEHGTRTTEGDRGGHTGDVAGTDATGEGHGQGLEGGDAMFIGLAGEHQANHFFEVANLEKAAAQGEVETNAETQIDQRRAPDQTV